MQRLLAAAELNRYAIANLLLCLTMHSDKLISAIAPPA